MRFALIHPREDVLVQVVLGEAMGDEARRVRDHLTGCHACRDRLQGVRVLRLRFLGAALEPVGDEGLARILQRRAGGERLILADGDMTPPVTHGGHRRVAAMIAVAASIALAAFAAWRAPSRFGPLQMAPTVVTMRSDSLAVVHQPRPQAAWLSLAYAADAPDVGDRVYGPAQLTRVSQLRAGARQYVRSVSGLNADYLPTESFVVDVSEAIFERRAAWRVVTSGLLPTERGAPRDTAWLGRMDLKLLFRRFHGRDDAEVLTQRVRGDTLLEQYTTIPAPSGSVRTVGPVAQHEMSIALNPRYPLVTDQGTFLLVLRALPLHKSWRGTIDINARSRSALFADLPRHVNLRVDGDSTIRTLWGDVSCWRVLLENGAEPERWFVGKESGDAMLVLRPASADGPRSRLNLLSRWAPLLPAMRVSAPAGRP